MLSLTKLKFQFPTRELSSISDMQTSGYRPCCPNCWHPFQTWLLKCQGKIPKCRSCHSNKCNIYDSNILLGAETVKRPKRERMTNRNRRRRAATNEARKTEPVPQQQSQNSRASTLGTSPSFLPPELRLMVYGHVFGPPGEVIVSTSQIKYVNVDRDALVLQHVCKAFREEIRQYFYSACKIVFTNKHTLHLWTQQYSEHLRKMSHVCVPVKALQLVIDNAGLFQNLTRLDIDMSVIRTERDYYTLCNSAILYDFSLKRVPVLMVMRCLERLAEVLPQFGPSMTALPFHYKFPATHYPEPRLQIKSKHAKNDNTLRPPCLPNGVTRKDYCDTWRQRTVADMTERIDNAVEQIYDRTDDVNAWDVAFSSIEKSWLAMLGSDRYNTFGDFVEQYLGRSTPN